MNTLIDDDDVEEVEAALARLVADGIVIVHIEEGKEPIYELAPKLH